MNVTDTRESTATRVNLLDFDHAALTEWCASIGEKPFRATQLSRWLHRHVECDFDKMTNLAKVFRAKLKDLAEVRSPQPIAEKKSADGTRKWLFDVGNGNAVESVFIPEDDRGTLCISTQAGCAMGCLFCSTGKQGVQPQSLDFRNRRSALVCRTRTAAGPRRDGSQRPNHQQRRPHGDGRTVAEPRQRHSGASPFLGRQRLRLSRRRVTVSTSGLVRQIDKLAERRPWRSP